MKKTRIIIPALAMIAFSVAASITGTVAWFTANRTAEIQAGSFTVVKTTANLEATVSSGIGTTANPSTNVVTVDNKLTDGSFEHRTNSSAEGAKVPTIFQPADSGTELAATNGTVALSSANTTNLKRSVDENDDDVYTVVTFGMSFTVTFGASPVDIGLYLDCTASKSRFEVTGPSETMATPSTAKGFRMAFVPNASPDAVARVFADLQTSGNAKHLDGTITSGWAAGNNYGGVAYSGDLIDSSYSTALPTSGNLAAYTGRVDYLGTFDYDDKDANNKVTLSYTVVCWFEGTDPEIVNRANQTDYQTVASYLHFEAKDLPSA